MTATVFWCMRYDVYDGISDKLVYREDQGELPVLITKIDPYHNNFDYENPELVMENAVGERCRLREVDYINLVPRWSILHDSERFMKHIGESLDAMLLDDFWVVEEEINGD